jgi:hypothetical protein
MDLDGLILQPVPTLKEEEREVPFSTVAVSFNVYLLSNE